MNRRFDTNRFAVIFPGDPRAPATWSGTPSGVMRGLKEWGAQVEAVSAELPMPLEFVVRNLVALPHFVRLDGELSRDKMRLARAAARAEPTLNRLYGLAATVRLRSQPALDGLVQIGAGYTLPRSYRYVTFEDLTVPQALELRYPEFEALSPRARSARLRSQRRAYDGAVACCFTTRWAADSAIASYRIPDEKVHVVGVGQNHVPEPRAERDWSVPRFLFVGVDWELKNGSGVLRAFSAIRRERPAATLDVVGRHPAIDADGVTGHGYLRLGDPAERAQVRELYAKATCFVMPSHREAAGIAYLEAAAAGLPSIGTAAGGSFELIGDGGRVVQPSDDGQLLDAMRDLCDPAVAAALGEAGRVRAQQYTWRLVAERLVRALAPPGVLLEGLAPFL